ncbi:fumarylacetoacetate hydrolase family protein [Noviherbaspirillum pedocola]|uniref:Fumarylacetoacetate hydrolase family protein n=1 Tax=Noviherbaspirillum pedocola TaxID=2801341 RepID=A0A934W5N1_9BURK|nr:fumarylacetoacetate hydrolase family protein [Noviherbaspirillum pedocola]MBK4735147.1 fumarylacetoacetate hydrolase family protein [Noviherbaspirillum pedocola]
MDERYRSEACMPQDAESALLIGRVWEPGIGPTLAQIRPDGAYDLTPLAATCSALLDLPQPAAAVRNAKALRRIAPLDALLRNSEEAARDTALPWLLAPCDLQAIKASGVTFVSSMLERVIEEQARGDASRAEEVRRAIAAVIGDDLSRVVPGSEDAARLKEVLIERGAWSQYLEVGIGPDAEIFTKAQPMSAVGLGSEIGLHPKSDWNNPEPEIVLAVNSRGETVGATLGNDVNLRDFEGRSALLLGKSKDNNASCAIGPFIRLFDEGYTIDHVRRCNLDMRIEGPEGFVLTGSSPMSQISRDPLDLVTHAMGPNHQYPDGMLLFLGTMFSPTEDRFAPGQGFTHEVGDIVRISTPGLGTLVNRVNRSDRIAPWTFGAGALMRNLAQRGLLS